MSERKEREEMEGSAEEELERRSKFLSSLIQKKKAIEQEDQHDYLNVRVRASDMPLALQNRAFRCARDHLDSMPSKLDSKRLALALKKVKILVFLFLLFLLAFFSFFFFFIKIFELGLFGYLFIGVIGVMGSESNLVWCMWSCLVIASLGLELNMFAFCFFLFLFLSGFRFLFCTYRII